MGGGGGWEGELIVRKTLKILMSSLQLQKWFYMRITPQNNPGDFFCV